MNILNLSGIKNAVGLEHKDQCILDECVRVLMDNYQKHQQRRDYYFDHVKPKNRGMKLPKEYKGLNCSTGWAEKTVDQLAERSVFDSFTFRNETPEGFEEVLRENELQESYRMALPSMLIEGVGFWTVLPDEDGQIVVNYCNAMTASGIWNWKRKKLKACFIINDFSRFGKSLNYVPSECVLLTRDWNIVLTREKRGNKSVWTADYRENSMGEVMAAPMVFKRTNGKPFGRSRISRAVMGYIDLMMSELQNTTIQSDIFSIPMKYILGCSDDQYKALAENTHKAYKAEMLAMTTNDDGGTPVMGMLQAADMTPHISYMNKLAALMASETKLPLKSFGVEEQGYTSSDALRASTDDLVILAKDVNKANANTMTSIAKMILALLGNKSLTELDDNEKTVTAHFSDPAMPSDAANADAMIKVVSAVPEFAGTPVFWEKLGYGEDDRRRIESSIAENKLQVSIRDALFGKKEQVIDNESNAGRVYRSDQQSFGSNQNGDGERNS